VRERQRAGAHAFCVVTIVRVVSRAVSRGRSLLVCRWT
jgi:hypothetical protein